MDRVCADRCRCDTILNPKKAKKEIRQMKNVQSNHEKKTSKSHGKKLSSKRDLMRPVAPTKSPGAAFTNVREMDATHAAILAEGALHWHRRLDSNIQRVGVDDSGRIVVVVRAEPFPEINLTGKGLLSPEQKAGEALAALQQSLRDTVQTVSPVTSAIDRIKSEVAPTVEAAGAAKSALLRVIREVEKGKLKATSQIIDVVEEAGDAFAHFAEKEKETVAAFRNSVREISELVDRLDEQAQTTRTEAENLIEAMRMMYAAEIFEETQDIAKQGE